MGKMNVEWKERASASAIAKILGIDFSKHKEFKTLLEGSGLDATDEEYVVKNKTIEYKAYSIVDAIYFCREALVRDNETTVAIDIEE